MKENSKAVDEKILGSRAHRQHMDYVRVMGW